MWRAVAFGEALWAIDFLAERRGVVGRLNGTGRCQHGRRGTARLRFVLVRSGDDQKLISSVVHHGNDGNVIRPSRTWSS